jgi:NADH:ubiquinone oxidoreductase subunit 2 (subunit N)
MMSLTNFTYAFFANLAILMVAVGLILRPPVQRKWWVALNPAWWINLGAAGGWVYLILQAPTDAGVFGPSAAVSRILMVLAITNILFLFYNGGQTLGALQRAVLANFLLGANLWWLGAQNIILALLALALIAIGTYFLLLLGSKALQMRFLWRFFVVDQVANIFILVALVILAKLGLGLQVPTAFSTLPLPENPLTVPLVTISVIFLLTALIFKLGPLPFSGWWIDLVANFKAEAILAFIMLGMLPVAYGLLRFIWVLLPTSYLALGQIPDLFYVFTGIMMAIYNWWAWKNRDFASSCMQGLLALAAMFLIFVPLSLTANVESELSVYMIYYILVVSGVLTILPSFKNKKTKATLPPMHPLQGLFYKNFAQAVLVVVLWAAVMGLPLTFGLPIKYILHMSVLRQGHLGGMICLLVGALATAAFWGHHLTYLFQEKSPDEATAEDHAVLAPLSLAPPALWRTRLFWLGFGLVVVLMGLGIYPSLLMAYFRG